MKKETTNKVGQTTIGLSLKTTNPGAFPLVYGSDMWDVADNDSSLAELLGGSGQYDQHEINEALAANAGGGGGTPGGSSDGSVYGSDVWDTVDDDSSLAELLGGPGQYDQHEINEALASNAGLSGGSAYGSVYGSDVVELVEHDSSLAGLLGMPGQYDQHEINEALARSIDGSIYGGEVWSFVYGYSSLGKLLGGSGYYNHYEINEALAANAGRSALDTVDDDSSLAELLGGSGEYDQHEINEALASNAGRSSDGGIYVEVEQDGFYVVDGEWNIAFQVTEEGCKGIGLAMVGSPS